MSNSCRLEGCVFHETGICALEKAPSKCENRLPRDEGETTDIDVHDDEGIKEQVGAPVLVNQSSTQTFGLKRYLGVEEVNTLMGTRYVNVVGILGEPESGKTACLVSLYLLLSHAKLSGWSFADSLSLIAFEDIARGARDWNNGQVPEQMTVHTELPDDRNPGFLHLRLNRGIDGRKFDLVLPDIPGEWTQTFVTNSRFDRLEFLKSAEVIWIVLDGRILANKVTRNGLIVRLGQLTGRLHTLCNSQMPRLLIVITHYDSCEVSKDVIARLLKELNRYGKNVEIIPVSPFSDNQDKVAAGFGINDLIDKTFRGLVERSPFWETTTPDENKRAYLSYRRSQ